MFEAIRYISGIGTVISLVAFLIFAIYMLANSGAARRISDPNVLRELRDLHLDPKAVKTLSPKKIEALVKGREDLNRSIATDIVAASYQSHYRYLTIVSLAITLLAAIIFVFSLVYTPHPDPVASGSIDVHPTIQFRAWTGYTDGAGREIPRTARFAGPLGMILTPVVNNVVTPAQSIFVKGIELKIMIADWEISLEPYYVTNITPENTDDDWMQVVEDFVQFSVPAGKGWMEDLAFKASDGMSYDDFLTQAANARDQNIRVELAVNLLDGRRLKSSCTVSGDRVWTIIEQVRSEHGVMPSFIQVRCTEEQRA